MGLTFTVGGSRNLFQASIADEVHELLDQMFGTEDDWRHAATNSFGTLPEGAWADLQRRATETLPRDQVENLLAMTAQGRGVFLPTHVRSIDLSLSEGKPLCCASLMGLRNELSELADRWDLSLEDEALNHLVDRPEDFRDAPGMLAFAQLALAANDAMRKGCPLWVLR